MSRRTTQTELAVIELDRQIDVLMKAREVLLKVDGAVKKKASKSRTADGPPLAKAT